MVTVVQRPTRLTYLTGQKELDSTLERRRKTMPPTKLLLFFLYGDHYNSRHLSHQILSHDWLTRGHHHFVRRNRDKSPHRRRASFREYCRSRVVYRPQGQCLQPSLPRMPVSPYWRSSIPSIYSMCLLLAYEAQPLAERYQQPRMRKLVTYFADPSL